MKKIVSMLMALVLLLSCGAFAAAESENGILGQWYLSEIQLASGNVISPYDILELVTLTLNEEGMSTYDMTTHFRSGVLDCIWSEKDDAYTLTFIDGETVHDMTYEVVDGVERLSIVKGSRTDVFTREAPEGEEIRVTAAATNLAPSDFDGTWVGVTYLVYDELLYMSTSLMNQTLYYEIADTYVTNFGVDNATGERTDFYTAENAEFSTTDSVSMLLTNASEYLSLHVDDSMVVSVNDANEMLICRRLTPEEIAELPASTDVEE